VAYNGLEALVAIGAGLRARSIALVGFGLDSIIELAAAGVVLWRIRLEARGARAEEVAGAEERVERFVGITFFLLALYVGFEAGSRLWRHEAPAESTIGIILAVASLLIMPTLALAKLRVARALGSAALRAEARETLACAYLSLTLLAGLIANAWLGWWWADPVAALLMVPWLVREGREAFE
ncbi:MAG TPA: cation transporter, partial [Longimicrobiales bacterium]|nr:cation transporter [Longimicrobiales bacterium]